MKEVLVLFFNWLPWLMGVALVYGLLFRRGAWTSSQHVIAIGCGAYVGYIAVAFIMYGLHSKNLPVFSHWLPAWCILLLIVFFLFGRFISFRSSPKGQVADENKAHRIAITGKWEHALSVLLTLWLLLVISFVTFEVALRPAIAWDTVWYWNQYASQWLSGQLSADETQVPTSLGHRHPFTVIMINAWSSFSNQSIGIDAFLFAPWLAVYFGTVATFFGLAANSHRSILAGPIVGLIAAATPLLEGQIALAGYADYWLAAGFLCSLAILSLSTQKVTPGPALLSFCTLLSLTLLKSAGVTYSFLLLIAAVMSALLLKIKPSILFGLLLAATGIILYVSKTGFDINIASFRVAYFPNSHIWLNHYWGGLRLVDWTIILHNLNVAWLKNSSLTLIPLCGLVVMWVLLSKRKLDFLNFFSLLSLALLTIHIIISQHLSSHFLAYSMPGQDTGLTRFSQIWFFSLLVCLTLFTSDPNRNKKR